MSPTDEPNPFAFIKRSEDDLRQAQREAKEWLEAQRRHPFADPDFIADVRAMRARDRTARKERVREATERWTHLINLPIEKPALPRGTIARMDYVIDVYLRNVVEARIRSDEPHLPDDQISKRVFAHSLEVYRELREGELPDGLLYFFGELPGWFDKFHREWRKVVSRKVRRAAQSVSFDYLLRGDDDLRARLTSQTSVRRRQERARRFVFARQQRINHDLSQVRAPLRDEAMRAGRVRSLRLTFEELLRSYDRAQLLHLDPLVLSTALATLQTVDHLDAAASEDANEARNSDLLTFEEIVAKWQPPSPHSRDDLWELFHVETSMNTFPVDGPDSSTGTDEPHKPWQPNRRDCDLMFNALATGIVMLDAFEGTPRVSGRDQPDADVQVLMAHLRLTANAAATVYFKGHEALLRRLGGFVRYRELLPLVDPWYPL